GDADEYVSRTQGPGDGRLMELQSEQENSAVSAAGRGGVEVLSGRCGPRARISQVHRVLLMSERVPCAARPRKARAVRRAEIFRACCGAGDASAGRSFENEAAAR